MTSEGNSLNIVEIDTWRKTAKIIRFHLNEVLCGDV